MTRDGDRSRVVFLALVLAAFALPAAASLAVLSVRARSVADPTTWLLSTSGGESVSIYNVMKARRGLPLYEDPRDPPYYASTLYNAGFYEAYATLARLFPTRADRVVPALRFGTLALACAGAAALLVIGPGRRTPRLVALAMALAAVATTLGMLPGWWLLTVRPDIGTAAFGALALASVLAFEPRREWAAGLLGGVFLAAAWSFKQSAALTLFGLLTAALLGRRYRLFAALLAPVVVTAAGCALLLGPEYRYNAFFATSLSGFDLHNLAVLVPRVLIKGAFPLAAAVASLWALTRVSWLRPDQKLVLKACWWTCLLGGVVTCCRNGSELNYFFELWTVVGFLAVIQARLLVESATLPGPAPALTAGLLAAVAFGSAGLDIARLARPGLMGSVRLELDPTQAAEWARARELARQETGPVFCEPALSGLAWDLPLPAYVFDDYTYFHQPAQRRGLLRGGGVPGLLASHHFRLVVLTPENRTLLDAAVSAGYRPQPGWSRVAVLTPPSDVQAGRAATDGRVGRRFTRLAVRESDGQGG